MPQLTTGNYFLDLALWIEYQRVRGESEKVILEKVRLSLLDAASYDHALAPIDAAPNQDGDEVGLLPCPFCGTSDALKIREDKSEDDPDWTVAYHVECGHCGCCGRNHYPIGWCESEQAAIEAWNHRGSIRPMYENPAPSVMPAQFEASAPLDWRNEAK